MAEVVLEAWVAAPSSRALVVVFVCLSVSVVVVSVVVVSV